MDWIESILITIAWAIIITCLIALLGELLLISYLISPWFLAGFLLLLAGLVFLIHKRSL